MCWLDQMKKLLTTDEYVEGQNDGKMKGGKDG